MKRRLQELAAEMLGWQADQVRLQGDRFVLADGSDSVDFESVADRILQGGPVETSGSYDSAEHVTPEGPDAGFCAYMVEVDVDRDTGQVKPVDAVLVAEVGTVINPLAHMGQLQGGFVFGFGNGVMEEITFDEGGKVTTLSLGDYKLPTVCDVPPLRTVLITEDLGPGPFGAKLAGELTNNAVAAAYANAVEDAIGVRIRTMPVTAQRVYEALHGG
jgi:CO/xanthine dehydrogenase Mo-binding subunit